MASTCNRVIGRVSSSLSSLKSAISKTKPSRTFSSKGSTTTSSSPPLPAVPRFSSITKSPVERLGCVQSLLPLHSAVAVARLNSRLSERSRSCRALSHELGLSVPR
ncbi:unnamed protein product [Ilex paraguariensis]|uniref:Uncharacterized protein n=1 Tax=Ilex paraguariensis TaxID=185542 RepID=A0ABC8V566_9AQUA